jgi:predicted ATPase
MMLVAGYSGIGKSSLVAEIHKPNTRLRGYFTEGKFDQFQAQRALQRRSLSAFQGIGAATVNRERSTTWSNGEKNCDAHLVLAVK